MKVFNKDFEIQPYTESTLENYLARNTLEVANSITDPLSKIEKIWKYLTIEDQQIMSRTQQAPYPKISIVI